MSIKEKIGNFLEQASLFFALLFYVLFAWHRWWSGVSPRLIRGSEEREAIHHAHLAIGSTLFVFLVLLFLIWVFRPGSSVLQKLKNAFSDLMSTAISLFFVFMFFAMLYGLAQAWAAGEHTNFLGVFPLPHFLDWEWGSSGYLHSSLSSMASALFAGIVFIYLYIKLCKYVKPGIAVGGLILLHLVVEMPKPPSLHPIAAFGTYVMVPAYYFVALALYTFAKNKKLVYWPVFLFFFAFFMYLPYFAFKVLPPWHQKPAAEIVLVESAQELSTIRPRSEIFADEASLAAAQEVATWCTQCHNATVSETHLLGPNLVGTFNRQAGTVEGYGRYSEAMVAAGLEGVFWTRENLAEYLTDGQNFIPDNLMNQQTDLSDPVRLNQVIDYMEYLSSE